MIPTTAPLRSYLAGFGLLLIASAMTAASDTERLLALPALAYGLLAIAAFSVYTFPITIDLIRWLEIRYESGSKSRSSPASPHWLKLAFLLLFAWTLIATEQLLTELSTTPEIQPVTLARALCSVSGSGKVKSSSLREADRDGKWCFVFTGQSVPESGTLHTFKLSPETFSPAPRMNGTVNGWLVSYDSLMFGRNAYSKVVGQP